MTIRKLLFALMLAIISMGSLNGCTPANNGTGGGDETGSTSTDSE